jgi:hypothetical protein
MENVTIHDFEYLDFKHHNGETRLVDVRVEVEWQHVDNSFDHAFGTQEQWDWEWVDYYILDFTVYDDDNEEIASFDSEDYERYDVEIFNGMDVVWRTYHKSVIDLVIQELDGMEPPDDFESNRIC